MHNSLKSWTVSAGGLSQVCGTKAAAHLAIVVAAQQGFRDIEVAIQTWPAPDSAKRIWAQGLEQLFAVCFTGKGKCGRDGWQGVEDQIRCLLRTDWVPAFMGRNCLGIQFGINPPGFREGFSGEQQQLLRDFVLGRCLTGFCGQVETLLDLDLEGYTIWGGEGDVIRLGIESALTG